MKRSTEIMAGSLPSYRLGVETYDPDKLGLGPTMFQANGAANEDDWMGPLPIAVGRPFESSAAVGAIYPWAMQWSSSATSQIDWIFLADNSTAAATRKVLAYEYNRLTATLTYKGFVTVTFPTATNYTIRALRMTYHLHTTGTVAVAGTAVTGTSSTWQSNRACVGNRIGFGSTDPTQIATWYEISAIASDTGITLTTSAGTIAAGTPYVIEDLRCVLATTNATATNGGLVVIKGLRYELFSNGGGAVPAATTVDNIRASYWLKDAATVTNTTANGLGMQVAGNSLTSQIVWVGNGTTTQQLFKYDIRGALTLASGADSTAFKYATGVSAALTGTASQANNGRCATLGHGPGSGSECFYFTTTTRVYRTKALSSITTGDTTFITSGDAMVEIPPGGANTIAASSLMNSVEVMGNIDKLLVALNVTNTPFRPYVTQYRTDSGQLDRVFGGDIRQVNQSVADSSITPALSMIGTAFTVWSEGGIAYIATVGATAATNFLYVVPLGADWEYSATTGAYIVTPRMALPDAQTILRACCTPYTVVGGASGKNLGTQAEPYRVSWRTGGISDNSGSWNLLDQSLRIGAAGAAYIQFKLEFRTMGFTCVPARIGAMGCMYEDNATLSNYQFSASKSDAANKRFAWRFATAFGSAVPALRVRLYDAVTGGLLVDDNTGAATGTFERSTNAGGAWSAWNSADKGNETTYLRYTPASLADNITVRALVTLN